MGCVRTPWSGILVAAGLWLLCPAVAEAQISPDASPLSGRAARVQNAQTPPRRPHDRPRLYFGMWTTHLKDDVIVLDNNWVVGLSARGWFGATFLNSYGGRAFAGGLQRTIVAADPDPLGASLGVRLGFITGYDERLMPIARKTPVLPLVQPFVTFDVSRIGVEVSYTFVVVSVASSFRF